MSFTREPSTSLVVLDSDPLVVKQQTSVQQAESGIIDHIDEHIAGLCHEMGQTSDSFRLRYLRMEVEENERRKGIVRRLFAQFWQREQLLILTFLRYRHGLLDDREQILEIAAEIDGRSTTELKSNYQHFRSLVLDDWKLGIAEQVVQEVYVHELQQIAHRTQSIDAPKLERRLDQARDRFAERALPDRSF